MKTFIKKSKKYTSIVQELRSGRYLAQITDNIPTACINKGFKPRTHVLENTNTVEEALDLIGWPYEIAGIPAELI